MVKTSRWHLLCNCDSIAPDQLVKLNELLAAKPRVVNDLSADGQIRCRFRRGMAIDYPCRACWQQATLSASTRLEGAKLPLRTWCCTC